MQHALCPRLQHSQCSAFKVTHLPLCWPIGCPTRPQRAAAHFHAPPRCCPASAGAELVIAPGFDVLLFVASAAFGAGRLYVNGMRAQNVTLQMSG